MKLTYFEGTEPNFGDELNKHMWSELVPTGFLDDDEGELFLGIGSILWDYLPKAPRKHVMGSGYGGYTPVPDVKDGSWNIVWLRGPMTAQKLGVDPKLAITDAAVLLRATKLPEPAPGIDIAFMPHFESVERGHWEEVCALAGITYLDPRDDTMTLIAKIRGARLLVTEAMHGAIVADALRTPFIPILPLSPDHRWKWSDWAQSVDLSLRPTRLPPSSLREAYMQLTGLQGKGARSRAILDHPLTTPAQSAIRHLAASALRNTAARNAPHLSSDAVIARRTDQSLEALQRFVQSRRPYAGRVGD